MTRRSLLMLVCGAFLVAGGGLTSCDDDSTQSQDTSTGDTADVEVINPWTAPSETSDWRVVYSYRTRVAGSGTSNELWLMKADGTDQFQITSFKDDQANDLSCDYGCFASPDLKWLAVATGPPDATGFSLKLGKFNADLEVAILKGLTLTGVIDFKFAGDRMFYSKQNECTGAICTYDYYVVELSENVNQPTKFLTFPPDNEVANSTYKGHFKVSSDGKHMVMLLTTIRSVGVWLWKDGTGLVELDFVCKFGTKGNCTGTGSEYADTDPVAIDPNGRWIVFFTFSERWQRARIYDIANPENIEFSIIAASPDGAYIEHACDPGVLADWQWQRVVGDPHITPDGQDVIFLTETTCTADGSLPPKPRTNIRRIKIATLLTGKNLDEDDVLNLTNHPFGDVTSNRRTTGLDISPDGATVVFTASPEKAQDGSPIPNTSARQRNDREVYRMNLEGTNILQLTNDVSLLAEAPLAVE